MKQKGATNLVLRELIVELMNKSREQNKIVWDRIAVDLGRPTRQRRIVNLSRINRYTKENEIVIVPGKVLGAGEIGHKLTISAFQFSDSARDKLSKNGSKIVSLIDLMKNNPTGKGIRIIG